MGFPWLKLTLACIICAKCVISGAGAAAVKINFYSSSSQPSGVNVYNIQGEKKEHSAVPSTSSDSKGEKKEDSAVPSISSDSKTKPSAHIVGSSGKRVGFPTYTVIEDWSASNPRSHLEGGMKYEHGKLTVPKAGRYYIYAHLQFSSEGRVQLLVNGDFVSLITSPVTKGGPDGMASGGGVFVLNAGDFISLSINRWGAPADGSVKLWMIYNHSYFGAFLI